MRRKSFEDLHKLWWVLVRERNMLETIRFQCRAEKRLMPNYHRLVKVLKSCFMKNESYSYDSLFVFQAKNEM